METQNTQQQHTVLIDSIGKYLVGMIEGIVIRKVNQIFESHAAMSLINDKMDERIKEIVRAHINDHESDYDHPSNDDISDMIATHVTNYNFADNIRNAVTEIMQDEDYATNEDVEQKIDEIDFEEQVKEVLRNI